MKKKILIFSVMLSMTFSVLAIAGNKDDVNRNNETQYAFVKGKGIPVCEDYYKNLVSFESYDIICERKINPKFSDFTKPKWIKLNLAKNKELLQQIIKFRGYSSQFADDKKIIERILKKDQRFPFYSTVKMYLSKIDINNDFKPDNIILFSAGSCEDMRMSEKFMVVLNEDKNMIDIEKTKQILINPPVFQAEDSRIINIHFTFHDIFYYKNRTYFDRWAVSAGIPEFNKDTLSVYKLSNNKAEEICRFKCNYGGWYSKEN